MSLFNKDRIPLYAGAAAAAMLTGGALLLMSANAAPPGAQAPVFKEADTAGRQVSLADFKGRTVVLEWTNNGCPFVQKHYKSGNMQRTQAAATKDPNVVWLTVISSAPGTQGNVTPAEADALTKDRGAHPTDVLLDPDGSMGRAFDAKTTPHIFVITPDGKIAYNGAIDSIASTNQADLPKATNYVLAALDNLKHGKAPDPALTAPYGCGVKYQ